MTGGSLENAYFRFRRTKSCLLDAKIPNGDALTICECYSCRHEALQKSHAIDCELAKDVHKAGKEVFLCLLGVTSTTNEVTKILLKMDNPSFGSVAASTTKLVVDYAKSTVRSVQRLSSKKSSSFVSKIEACWSVRRTKRWRWKYRRMNCAGLHGYGTSTMCNIKHIG